MSDQYLHRFSDHRQLGPSPFSSASSTGDLDDDWVGRFGIASVSLDFPHFKAATGAH